MRKPTIPKMFLSKRLSYSLGLIILFFLSFASLPLLMPPPGLSEAKPIGKFLNNTLPALTPGGGAEISWDVEPAYPNLTFEDPIHMLPHPRERGSLSLHVMD
ncbi:MAG: hypothetical protein AAF696_06450 [Bacteroidota bacterium]